MSEQNIIGWHWETEPIGRLIRIANRALRRELRKQLKPFGMSPTQWSALGIIRSHPGVLASELEKMLSIERPSVTSLIQGLMKKKWVYRREHPDDGRYKLLYLTDKGEQMASETEYFAEIIDARVREKFSSDEFETLRRLLIKMIHSFEQEH